ncbi:MAG: hypothetical protein IJX99_01290 [Clostridia bacterium]|nr:hypothetical protein [Clostridia bacterium]
MGFGDFVKNAVAALRFAIGRGDDVSESRIIKFAKTMHPSKEAFESLGFEFSESNDSDTFEVKLPEGWRASNCIGLGARHYHNIYDEKNRRRVWYLYGVSPFGGAYGCADLLCRYIIADKPIDEKECEYDDEASLTVMYIADRALQPRECCLREIGIYDEDEWEKEEELGEQAWKYMSENFPDWRNPLAYWD